MGPINYTYFLTKEVVTTTIVIIIASFIKNIIIINIITTKIHNLVGTFDSLININFSTYYYYCQYNSYFPSFASMVKNFTKIIFCLLNLL